MTEAQAVPQTGRLGEIRAADATEVLLVRHGESAAVVPGTPEADDPPLSERGQEQAAALAARLAGKRIDGVWSSDLARARQTAEALAGPRTLDVVQRRELREVHLGDWEHGEFRRRAATGDPEFLAWAATGRWETIPNGEPDDALRARITAAVDEAVAAHRGGTIAVVCHGGAINAWLAHFTGSYRSFVASIDNTSITRLLHGDGRWLVLGVNDHHHLGDPLVGQ